MNVAVLRAIDDAGLRPDFLFVAEAQSLFEERHELGDDASIAAWTVSLLQDTFRRLSTIPGSPWVSQAPIIYLHLLTEPKDPNVSYTAGSYGGLTRVVVWLVCCETRGLWL